jgi:hypothetical protein
MNVGYSTQSAARSELMPVGSASPRSRLKITLAARSDSEQRCSTPEAIPDRTVPADRSDVSHSSATERSRTDRRWLHAPEIPTRGSARFQSVEQSLYPRHHRCWSASAKRGSAVEGARHFCSPRRIIVRQKRVPLIACGAGRGARPNCPVVDARPAFSPATTMTSQPPSNKHGPAATGRLDAALFGTLAHCHTLIVFPRHKLRLGCPAQRLEHIAGVCSSGRCGPSSPTLARQRADSAATRSYQQ